MKPPSGRSIIRFILWALGAVFGLIVALFLFLGGPGGSGTLAQLHLPDGSEYKVTQQYNWSAEPYTVDFFMRKGEEPWGWCYIDHEASRWRNVIMVHDPGTDSIVVTENGTRRAVLDRKRGTFWMDNGQFSGELDAPQIVAGGGSP